jgi:hypothetical protein
MRVRNYKTAVGRTVAELDEKVNALIEDGYQPFGSPYFVAVVEGNVNQPICQAMTRDQSQSGAHGSRAQT